MILLTENLKKEQTEQIRLIAPAARILTSPEIEKDPGLAEIVQICYPSLPRSLWPLTPRLEWVQVTSAGVDQLLKDPDVRAHPAVITNVHIHAASVAEHLWGMTLMLTRNLARAARLQVQRAWDHDHIGEGLSSLAGRWLCVAGLGVIGQRCAEIGRAFGMRVIGISRRGRTAPGVDEVVGPGQRGEAFARSRVIMLILPDTPETKGFAGPSELAGCRGAYLVNAGRGPSVDTDALVAALKAGTVRGAGLDVTDPEPLPAGHVLWDMPNVVISPHFAGMHPGYQEEAFAAFIANLGRWTRGETLENVVDRETGY